jgi:two-component system, cell cycle sensor histidine kinase and response regulator CckA
MTSAPADSVPLRVLCLEDETRDAELIEELLTDSGFQVSMVRVANEIEFVAALRDRVPDIILSDYTLPGFDGAAALRRASEEQPATPFICVSGTLDDEAAVALLKNGATDYVLKDRMGRLPNAVRRALEDAKARREHQRAEAALQESEVRFRTLFDNMAEGLAYCRMLYRDDGQPDDFVYLAVNKAFTTLTGLPDVVGRRVSEVIPGIRESDGELIARYARVAMSGQSESFEFHLEALNMWFDLSVYSPRRAEFVTVFDVITARKQAEAEHERLIAAIEQSGEAVVITDPSGVIQYVNPAFETITGYSRSEAVGQTPRVLKSGHHDESWYRAFWATLLGGHTWQGRIVNRRKDGSLFTEEAVISPVCDAAGRIVNFVAVTRDITEHLRLSEQFHASQRMEAIGRLAGGIAHDFNNLLTVILNCTAMAIDGLRAGDPMREDLEDVQKAGERAAALTRQLLAFSRKQVLEPRTIDLNQIVASIERMLRRLVGEDIELEQVLASDLGMVRADPGQIEQVIMNLVVNARDAMPSGGKLTIETSNVEVDESHAATDLALPPGRYAMLAVSDTGCGMDAATRQRLFEPFFTTKAKGEGTGLGLSTVYGIVRQSGGNIFAYSELGIGTTFKIYLPRLVGEAAGRPVDVPSPRPAVGRETILLVEDEDAVRKVAVRMLQTAGYRVLAAANGGEALLTCEEHEGEIDLLVTDVVMPQMSGRRLAERLRRLQPNLRTLFMSGYTDDAIVRHGVLPPGTKFIGKPFNEAEFARKVRDTLDTEPSAGFSDGETT